MMPLLPLVVLGCVSGLLLVELLRGRHKPKLDTSDAEWLELERTIERQTKALCDKVDNNKDENRLK